MKKTMLLQKKIGIVLFSLVFASSMFAENTKAKGMVKAEQYQKLLSLGSISDSRDNGSKELTLLPETVYSDKVKASMVAKESKNFPFTYEGLYLLNKQDLLKKSNSTKETITIEDVSKVTRSVSKMQGMKYYSTTKKKECVLYEKAYMIADEKGSTAIPDQNTGNADGQVSYCYQDDSSFGVNRYKLNYFQSDDSLMAQFVLLDTMGLGPFKAIYPGKMVINIVVVDCGDDLLLYMNTDLDSVKFPGIKGQITDSMTSRMDAVFNWFITQF